MTNSSNEGLLRQLYRCIPNIALKCMSRGQRTNYRYFIFYTFTKKIHRKWNTKHVIGTNGGIQSVGWKCIINSFYRVPGPTPSPKHRINSTQKEHHHPKPRHCGKLGRSDWGFWSLIQRCKMGWRGGQSSKPMDEAALFAASAVELGLYVLYTELWAWEDQGSKQLRVKAWKGFEVPVLNALCLEAGNGSYSVVHVRSKLILSPVYPPMSQSSRDLLVPLVLHDDKH